MWRLIKFLFRATLFVIVATYALNFYVLRTTSDRVYDRVEDMPAQYTAIVLGAGLSPNKKPSPVLQDRLDAAYVLYMAGKVKRILVSGDHGTKSHNEPLVMRKYLEDRGVPSRDIFMDHAGFDTYDSMWRAKHIFEVDRAIVVTQKFHLPRAIYIAERLGLTYQGVIADAREYQYATNMQRREYLANVKAWGELLINKEPTYAGDVIPITGDAQLSW